VQEEKIVFTRSSSETQKFAEKLAPFLRAGDIISLTGDLGAGKTYFTQGLARGLGIDEKITSPTFTLIKEYSNINGVSLFHFDVYRLKSLQEMLDIGYDEYFFGDGVTVVEWGDKITPLISDEFLEIELKRLSDENTRKIKIITHGRRWEKAVKNWLKESQKSLRTGIDTLLD